MALMRILTIWVVFGLTFSVLAATRASADDDAVYTVRAGDNLTVIGRKFGLTFEQLLRANNLRSDAISVGQRLTLPDPLANVRAREVRWARPVRRPGAVLRPFGPYKQQNIIMPQTGTRLSCAGGTRVTSPAHGVVRHVGPLDGFGVVMLIEHGGGFVTVLAPFDPETVSVHTGQAVLRGDFLGQTAAPAETSDEPYIHLELRQGDRAVAPDRLYK